MPLRHEAGSKPFQEYPDLLKYAREGSPKPLGTDPFAQASENAGLRARHLHFGVFGPGVAAKGKNYSISVVFRRETLYKCNPSSRLPGTTTPSSGSIRTASSSRAAGSPRTWRASACEMSP